jgi:hypothetical protein
MSGTDDIVRFFAAVDDRDWDVVRAGLADELDTDYTSLFGGEPEHLAADALVERWRGMLPGFDATQHFLGPIVVDPDGSADCNVRGSLGRGSAGSCPASCCAPRIRRATSR